MLSTQLLSEVSNQYTIFGSHGVIEVIQLLSEVSNQYTIFGSYGVIEVSVCP